MVDLESRKIPHSYFNNDIYEWTLRMELGKWYSIKNIKMSKEDFTNCIIYLISVGEPLILKNDLLSIRREKSLTEYVESNDFDNGMMNWLRETSQRNNHPLTKARSPERLQAQKEYWENFWNNRHAAIERAYDENEIDELSTF